jgi:hypothetical protein
LRTVPTSGRPHIESRDLLGVRGLQTRMERALAFGNVDEAYRSAQRLTELLGVLRERR